MHPFILLLAAFFSIPTTLVKAQGGQTCNAATKCPVSAPCCSPYGYCGTGTFCLGGCEPLFSNTPASCLPQPACQSKEHTFYNTDRVLLNATKYDGNATAYDWIMDTGEVEQQGDGLRLLLKEDNSGTKLSSTRYVHYGTIDFVLKSTNAKGAVTAAITMSDVRDEIDWEWTDTDATKAQTNWFFLGQANYSAGDGSTFDVGHDSSETFTTFTLDWQEDMLTWKIDGRTVRQLVKADQLMAEGGYKYPSTPSRVQVSIWPAGIATSAPGTVEWAGGMIDWNSPEYQQNGYYHATLQSINIACAQDETNTGITGYQYEAENATGNIPCNTLNSILSQKVLETNRSTLIGGSRLTVGLPGGHSGLFGFFTTLLFVFALSYSL